MSLPLATLSAVNLGQAASPAAQPTLGHAVVVGTAYCSARILLPRADGDPECLSATYHPSASAGEASRSSPGARQTMTCRHPTRRHHGERSSFSSGPDDRDRPHHCAGCRSVARLPADSDGLSTVTDRQGGFVFPAVPAGQYALRMTRAQVTVLRRGEPEPTMVWLDLPLAVGSEDIENLGVTAHAGLRISGRFEFEGEPSRPRASLQNVQISIESADATPGTPARPMVARANAAGEFVSPQIPGGRNTYALPIHRRVFKRPTKDAI